MMKTRVSVKVSGVGKVQMKTRWLCKTCKRGFKLPRIIDTPEEIFSTCWTCFAASCIPKVVHGSEKKS